MCHMQKWCSQSKKIFNHVQDSLAKCTLNVTFPQLRPPLTSYTEIIVQLNISSTDSALLYHIRTEYDSQDVPSWRNSCCNRNRSAARRQYVAGCGCWGAPYESTPSGRTYTCAEFRPCAVCATKYIPTWLIMLYRVLIRAANTAMWRDCDKIYAVRILHSLHYL